MQKLKPLQSHCIFCEDALFKPMKVNDDGSCLYWAIALHIMSCCLDVRTGRFPPGKKPGIKQATYEVVNDLKQLISQKDNALLENVFSHTTQGVDECIKKKIEEWDFVMTLTEMNKKHELLVVTFKYH